MVKTTNQIAIPVSKENALNLCTGSTRQPTVWVGTTENLGHLMRLCWNLASYIKRFFGGWAAPIPDYIHANASNLGMFEDRIERNLI